MLNWYGKSLSPKYGKIVYAQWFQERYQCDSAGKYKGASSSLQDGQTHSGTPFLKECFLSCSTLFPIRKSGPSFGGSV